MPLTGPKLIDASRVLFAVANGCANVARQCGRQFKSLKDPPSKTTLLRGTE